MGIFFFSLFFLLCDTRGEYLNMHDAAVTALIIMQSCTDWRSGESSHMYVMCVDIGIVVVAHRSLLFRLQLGF